MGERVAVLGASPKPERFANRAQRMLVSHGHAVLPVNPALDAVEGLPTVPLEALPEGLDTVTVYLGASRMLPLVEQLAGCKPRRIILNPGADDPEVVRALGAAGMRVQLACTLVLLESGRYEAF